MTSTHLYRHGQGYEVARRATVWNGRIPSRYPDVIVQATTEEDVVDALRYARTNALRVTICSGGRSWAASHLRDGGLLLDVGRLDSCSIDVEKRTAVVGPGMDGSVFAAELDARGLFFPTGHCAGVAMGGYLLQGGYGWNSRALGPACESVTAVDVITADGERLRCDDVHHSDLFWAARGAGPGFFGVVTAFHVRLYDRPATFGSSLRIYPNDVADDVFTWALDIGPEIGTGLELQVIATHDAPGGTPGLPGIIVTAPVFADSDFAAREALKILDTCPVGDRALVDVPFTPKSLATAYEEVMAFCPTGHRYATDNMWISSSSDALVPGIRSIIDTMPPSPSQLVWVNWSPSTPRQDMAFSLEHNSYMTLYAAWESEADDLKYSEWPTTNMSALQHLSPGILLADENLGQRPAKFVSDSSMVRLDAIRAAYDPEDLFQSWMGRL